jgi:hypothetical protein
MDAPWAEYSSFYHLVKHSEQVNELGWKNMRKTPSGPEWNSYVASFFLRKCPLSHSIEAEKS